MNDLIAALGITNTSTATTATDLVLLKKNVQTIELESNYEYVTRPVNDQFFSRIVANNTSFINGPWVAGGSARKIWFGKPWQQQDIDFFFANDYQFQTFCKCIQEWRPEKYRSTMTHKTQNAITYVIDIDGEQIKVQAIHKNFYKSYHAVLTSFDFTVSQFITDGRTVLATTNAIRDCQNNVIRANPSNNRNVALRRVLKYAAYGFDPDPKLLIDAIGNVDGWFEDEY